MNNKLYVIGNGFDLHHNLKTSYYSFANYLKVNNRELYDALESYVSYPSSHDDLWWQFEDNLANLDADEILSENTDWLPDYGSDDFRDRDRHVFPDIMQNYLELLTSGLIKSFTEFIQEVEYPESSKEYLIELDKDSSFLTFNYTKTLELLYGVDKKKITYIHNSAFYGSEDIILGHGISPENFEEVKPEPPDDIEPEDYEQWYADNDEWEYSYDTGKEELWKYFELTFKPTLATIQKNNNFFKSLNHIESIYILGHSISQIDLPYFVELVKHTNENVVWNVSYYNTSEMSKHLETLKSIGIKEENIKQFELIDIQKNNRQLKLELLNSDKNKIEEKEYNRLLALVESGRKYHYRNFIFAFLVIVLLIKNQNEQLKLVLDVELPVKFIMVILYLLTIVYTVATIDIVKTIWSIIEKEFDNTVPFNWFILTGNKTKLFAGISIILPIIICSIGIIYSEIEIDKGALLYLGFFGTLLPIYLKNSFHYIFSKVDRNGNKMTLSIYLLYWFRLIRTLIFITFIIIPIYSFFTQANPNFKRFFLDNIYYIIFISLFFLLRLIGELLYKKINRLGPRFGFEDSTESEQK